MKLWTQACLAAVAFAVIMAPLSLGAQGEQAKPHHYKLIDLGTFGGPNSYFFTEPIGQSVNNRGVVVSGADTPAFDPLAPNCLSPDCHIIHAFKWKSGVLTDLGTLPGGANSEAFWVNERGLIFGISENGLIDPITGVVEQLAVVWNDGQITDLGTLGGGSFSFPNAMNNRGQVVGMTLTTIPDPFSYIDFEIFGSSEGTQTHAFLWQHGIMIDLETLGGPDSWAAAINDRGQVVGWSFVNATPNSVTGVPTQHPFLWEKGAMVDLGSLGGTIGVVGSLLDGGAGGSVNNRGQVIGTSNLAGDQIHHPFLWDMGKLKDLGTLGGNNGEAFWINDAGEVVGRADFSPASTDHHAFLWRHGVMKDLGTLNGQTCSTALDINARSQIVGDTGVCGGAGGPGFLWENGALYDLNTLIPADSGLAVGDVAFINDRGEIAAAGLLPNGDEHDILLIPCDENHPDIEGCEYNLVDATTAATARLAPDPQHLSQPTRSTFRQMRVRNRFLGRLQ